MTVDIMDEKALCVSVVIMNASLFTMNVPIIHVVFIESVTDTFTVDLFM